MDLNCVSFINYFIVPIIGVQIYNRRRKKEVSTWVELLNIYAIFTVLNLILTKVVVSVVENTIKREVNGAGTKYTITAVFSVVILTVLLDAFQHIIRVDYEITKKEDNKND